MSCLLSFDIYPLAKCDTDPSVCPYAIFVSSVDVAFFAKDTSGVRAESGACDVAPVPGFNLRVIKAAKE